MALDPVEFDTSTIGAENAEPPVALAAEGKPAGGRDWRALLWMPLMAVILVLIAIGTAINYDLKSARNEIDSLKQEVGLLQSENQQLQDQVKEHAKRATRSLEFGQVLVGRSSDTLADTAGAVHLEQAGLETIQFVATGPSALTDATAYGNLSVEFVEPDGESMCGGALAIENGDSNAWSVKGQCSGAGQFAAGEWQIRFSYRGRTFARAFTLDASSQ